MTAKAGTQAPSARHPVIQREMVCPTCKSAWRSSAAASDRKPGALTLQIEDDGKGWDAGPFSATSGHPAGDGLSNMQKRMAQLGGRFAQQSKTGSGTSVRLELPLRKS